MKLQTIGKIAAGIFYAIAALILLWILISWIDVLAYQHTTGTQHGWNAFVLLLEGYYQ